MTRSEPLLQLRDLRVDVGSRNVLKSISLDVEAGALEIAGRDQPVMAAPDDQSIVLSHS